MTSAEDFEGAAHDQGSGITTLEKFRAPTGLCGRNGKYRLDRKHCAIDADTDAKAVSEWLASTMRTDQSYGAARSAIEKLLNWAVYERGVAVSSLERGDMVAFIDFLGNPWPSSKWVSPRGIPRGDPRWRPFYQGQAQRSVVAILSHCRSCFRWLGQQGYANLFRLSTAVHVRNSFTDQDDFAACARAPGPQQLTQSDWSWVEAQLADPEDDTSLDERLVLELQFFGGFKLCEIQELRPKYFVPPDQQVATWRILDPSLHLGRTWVFALPPLASTLEVWFRQTSFSWLRSGPHAEEPIFPVLATVIRGVRRLLGRAACRAACGGSHASAERLGCCSSVTLRTSFEHIAGGCFSFLVGLSANAQSRNETVAEYARGVPMTQWRLDAAFAELSPWWSSYPITSGTAFSSQKTYKSTSRWRTLRKHLEKLRLARRIGEQSSPTAIYRSLDRYIRRHVVPRTNAVISRWIANGDPAAIGAVVADSTGAQRAWAYVLWIFTLEPSVQARRFRRHGSIPTEGNRRVLLSADGLAMAGALDQQTAQKVVRSSSQLGVAMLQAWLAAAHAARQMSIARLVHWGPGVLRFDPLRPFRDKTSGEGEGGFGLLAAPRRSKEQRRLHHNELVHQRQHAMVNRPGFRGGSTL